MFGGSFSLSGGYKKKRKASSRKRVKVKRHCSPTHRFLKKTQCIKKKKKSKKRVKKSRRSFSNVSGGYFSPPGYIKLNQFKGGGAHNKHEHQNGGRRSSRKMRGGQCGKKVEPFQGGGRSSSRKMRGGFGSCGGSNHKHEKNNQGGGRRSSRKMRGGFGSCGGSNHKHEKNNQGGGGAHNKHKEHQKGGVIKLEEENK